MKYGLSLTLPVIFLVLLVSCSTNQQYLNSYKAKKYCFQMPTLTTDYESKKDICLSLPNGARKKKIFTGNDRIMIEYQLRFNDASVFYIRNDVWSISRLNVQNLYDIGVTGHRKKNPIDTISYSGQSVNSSNWKEMILGEVIVGYVNASDEKKEIFDSAIESVEIK